jgi:hypothetical protein
MHIPEKNTILHQQLLDNKAPQLHFLFSQTDYEIIKSMSLLEGLIEILSSKILQLESWVIFFVSISTYFMHKRAYQL